MIESSIDTAAKTPMIQALSRGCAIFASTRSSVVRTAATGTCGSIDFTIERSVASAARGETVVRNATYCGVHGLCSMSRRSEEHTSELQSHSDLVCRLLLEKKKKQQKLYTTQNHHKNKLIPDLKHNH